jgi:hypothetical protein
MGGTKGRKRIMPLYLIQDNDRPLWIVAKSYGQAEQVWKKIVAQENEISLDEVESPKGINFICDDMDLVLNGDHWKSYCL